MPLGASRLNFLAKLLEEPVISRTQVVLTAGSSTNTSCINSS
jgi:hypothetical protein